MVSYINMEVRAQSTVRRRGAAQEKRLDCILHALSHRTRRALLARLAAGPAMVRELAEPFAVTRIAISKHLRILEEAGLVTRTVDGRIHRCALSMEPLQELEGWLAEYRQFWSDKLRSLARYVEQSDRQRRKPGSAE
jgi:DNA-binding transcriptional ArsR family regulator